MAELAEFSRQVESRLAAARQEPAWSPGQVQQFMAELAPRRERFEQVADRIVATIVRPRMEKLASYFDNAKLAKADQKERCACWFGYSNRFPATAKLEIAVEHDEAIENLAIAYELYMMPVFLKFDAHDKLRVPLAAPDDQAISAWVERKLLEFLDTYLRLDRGQEDFEQDAVVDPVCGMRITRETAQTTTQYRGHPYYFCSEDCRSRFVAEPPRYIRFETG